MDIQLISWKRNIQCYKKLSYLELKPCDDIMLQKLNSFIFIHSFQGNNFSPFSKINSSSRNILIAFLRVHIDLIDYIQSRLFKWIRDYY